MKHSTWAALGADSEDFMTRLGRGIERLQSGDLSMFASAPPAGRDGQQGLAALLQELAAAHEDVRIIEAGIVDAARRAEMDETTIVLCQERGRRRGRQIVATLATSLVAPIDEGSEQADPEPPAAA